MTVKTSRANEAKADEQMMRTENEDELVARLVSFLRELKNKRDESDFITKTKARLTFFLESSL